MNPSIARFSLRTVLQATALVAALSLAACVGETNPDDTTDTTEQSVSDQQDPRDEPGTGGGGGERYLRSSSFRDPGEAVSKPHPQPWTDKATPRPDLYNPK